VLNVSNATQLQAALASAKAGDTIKLAAGNYGNVSITSKNFSTDVTITSADPTHPATFASLSVSSSSHLDFSGVNINFVPTSTTYDFSPAVHINLSSNITLQSATLVGGVAINGVAQTATALNSFGTVNGLPVGYGVDVTGSSNVTLSQLNISQFGHGVVLSDSTGVSILNSNIHNVRTSPIVGADTGNLTISGNTLSASNPWQWGNTPYGDHADFIHLWTDTNLTAALQNITITNNVIEQGTGTAILGISLQDESGFGFANVNISDNALLNGNAQGIRLEHVATSTVEGNVLLQSSGAANDAPGIVLADGSNHVTLSGNVTGFIADTSAAGNTADPSNTTLGNFGAQTSAPTQANYYTSALVSAVESMTSASAIAAYVKGHVAFAPDSVTSSVSYTLGATSHALTFTGTAAVSGIGNNLGDVITGNAGTDHLTGGSGNDTFIAGTGNELIWGQAGNNTFVFGLHSGHDTVEDFAFAGDHNVLNISAFLTAGMHPILSDTASGVVISFSGSSAALTLLGVHANQLQATAVGFTLH